MTIIDIRRIAGRKGGRATKKNHSLNYFRELGSRGGRPRLLTLEEIKNKEVRLERVSSVSI